MRFLRETYIVFRRQLRMNLRNPAWVIIGLSQPVLYLFLFGPLLEPLTQQFGYQNAYTFFVPGMLVQLGVFGAFFAGFGLIAEWREGVVEAERVTPASRTALLVGRLLRDLLQILVQSTSAVIDQTTGLYQISCSQKPPVVGFGFGSRILNLAMDDLVLIYRQQCYLAVQSTPAGSDVGADILLGDTCAWMAESLDGLTIGQSSSPGTRSTPAAPLLRSASQSPFTTSAFRRPLRPRAARVRARPSVAPRRPARAARREHRPAVARQLVDRLVVAHPAAARPAPAQRTEMAAVRRAMRAPSAVISATILCHLTTTAPAASFLTTTTEPLLRRLTLFCILVCIASGVVHRQLHKYRV